jgi:urease accessory protein
MQHLELQGQWLDRGLIDAADARLMDGPLGLAGRRCIATLYFACGSDISRERREVALQVARDVLESHELAHTAGATAPGPRVIVVRLLAPLVEPAMQLLKSLRAQWRQNLWNLAAVQPRTWAL